MIFLVSLFQRSPLIGGVNIFFYVCGRFSTPFYINFGVGPPPLPQQPQSVFEGAHICRFFGINLTSITESS